MAAYQGITRNQAAIINAVRGPKQTAAGRRSPQRSNGSTFNPSIAPF